MIESNVCRAHQRMEIDLLPWADPYIMQLFAESEQWGRFGLVDSAGEVKRAPDPAGSAEPAITAPFCSESWRVNATRRPTTPRRRRTESERSLARC